MKRFFTVLSLVCAFAFFSKSDARAQIYVGPAFNFVVPVGDFGNAYPVALGGSLNGKIFVNDALAVGAHFGILNFFEQGGNIQGRTFMGMPFVITGDYHFDAGGVRPYVGLGIGFHTFRAALDVLGQQLTTSNTYFGISPGGGVLVPASDALAINIGARFHAVFGSNRQAWHYSGLNLGLLFNLGG